MNAQRLTQRARKVVGSTKDLAARVGVSRRSVEHWMAGRKQPCEANVKAMQAIMAEELEIPEGVVQGP